MAFEPLFGKHNKILAVYKLPKIWNYKEILDKIKAGGQIPPLNFVYCKELNENSLIRYEDILNGSFTRQSRSIESSEA